VKSALPGSAELLEKALACLGQDRSPRLIGIDGADGVGKSSLASWLAWQLGAPAIHLDLYTVRDSEPPQWRTEDLQRVLTTRLDEHARPLVIEGIMLLEVLAKIGREVDFLVYVDGEGSHSLSQMLADYRARHQPDKHTDLRLQAYVEAEEDWGR
jgi:uridine kinase